MKNDAVPLCALFLIQKRQLWRIHSSCCATGVMRTQSVWLNLVRDFCLEHVKGFQFARTHCIFRNVFAIFLYLKINVKSAAEKTKQWFRNWDWISMLVKIKKYKSYWMKWNTHFVWRLNATIIFKSWKNWVKE